MVLWCRSQDASCRLSAAATWPWQRRKYLGKWTKVVQQVGLKHDSFKKACTELWRRRQLGSQVVVCCPASKAMLTQLRKSYADAQINVHS